jgi:TRAP-type transport system small permease protein
MSEARQPVTDRPSRLARALRRLAAAAEAASATAFAAMFLLFLAGIFARYVLKTPLVWSDELIMIIFLWMVFLTEAFVITEREQVTFDGIYELVGERWRRAILAAGALLVALMFLAALPTVYDYVRFLWRDRTTALQWRLDVVYLCFVVFWAAVIVRAVVKLIRLLGPGWRDEVAIARPDERANVLG